MEVPHALVEQEEPDACRVERAARHQPVQAGSRQRRHQRAEGKQDQPAHQHIDQQREDACAVANQQLLRDADRRQSPVHPEQRPAPGPAQRHQREGRIAAGDQQVDGAVVEPPQDVLRAAAQAVIERGDGVEEDQRGAIDHGADYLPGVVVEGRGGDQHCCAGGGENGAGQVAVAVETFSAVHVVGSPVVVAGWAMVCRGLYLVCCGALWGVFLHGNGGGVAMAPSASRGGGPCGPAVGAAGGGLSAKPTYCW